jgi:hypothetical protein
MQPSRILSVGSEATAIQVVADSSQCKAEFAHNLLLEGVIEPGTREGSAIQYAPLLRRSLHGPSEYARHFLLPDISGDPGYGSIRENYPDESLRSAIWSSNRHWQDGKWMFFPVEQETMWAIRGSTQAIIWAGLSVCSCLCARSESEIFVAHIGFSYVKSIDAVLGFFEQQGIRRSAVMAVASTGALQLEAMRLEGVPRYYSPEQYYDCGILPKNLMHFEYGFEPPPGTLEPAVHRNLSRVVVFDDEISLFSGDTHGSRLQSARFVGALHF